MAKKTDQKIIFIDASSAILLYKANLFIHLARTFSVVMAGSVFSEVTAKEYPGTALFKALAGGPINGQPGIFIMEFASPAATLRFPINKPFSLDKMDRGEKDTIENYLGHKAAGYRDSSAFILMDDGKGARFCRGVDIPFINALLVPKIFWYSGIMEESEYLEKTDQLCRLGHYSKKIIRIADGLSRDDLNYFIGTGNYGN